MARYTAVVFLDFVPVTSEAMVRMNPLGIIIKDIEFSIVSPPNCCQSERIGQGDNAHCCDFFNELFRSVHLAGVVGFSSGKQDTVAATRPYLFE